MTYNSRKQQLREEIISEITIYMSIPDLRIESDIPLANWVGPSDSAPKIIEIRMFDDKESPIEGQLHDGRHYIGGTVKVLWDNAEGTEEEDYVDLLDIDTDTLCDIADFLLDVYLED